MLKNLLGACINVPDTTSTQPSWVKIWNMDMNAWKIRKYYINRKLLGNNLYAE